LHMQNKWNLSKILTKKKQFNFIMIISFADSYFGSTLGSVVVSEHS